MPRSSRHKSSKHSSRETRDYSDSERESGLKEKKGRDDSRHLKDSVSGGEKRKLESNKSVDIVAKESIGGSGNVEYIDEYGPSSSSSKKRREKVDDDRWTGGDNIEHELSKSEVRDGKGSGGESKRSSRRDESLTLGFDGEEGKRSGSKVESKHHRSSDRKERGEKDGGSERERKGSKTERLVDDVSNEGNKKQGNVGEERGGKHGVGNTDCHIQDEFRNSESERELDRRVRRKRDGSGDGDKHQDGARELDDRRLSSRDDTAKSIKYKDDGHKDEKIRDKYREDVDKESSHQDEKHRDNRSARDYASGKSDDKHVRTEKKDLDVSQKKSKPHGSEYERDREREWERDRDHDRDRERDRDRDRSRHDHDRDRDRDPDDRENEHDRDRDRDRDLERGHDRDRELDRDRDRGRDRYRRERDRDRIRDRDYNNHDRGRDRDYDHDHVYGAPVDERGSRYKEDRGRRRSPDGYDDYHHGDKARRLESEADKERSLLRKAHVDSVATSSRRRASPSSRSYIGTDKYRDGMQDDNKYGDSLRDGNGVSEVVDKAPKYRSGEKRSKFEDNHIGEPPERSPSAKASPAGFKERSPSSTSVDRRFRTGRRRSLDVDEAERRSCGSNDIRDGSVTDDRQGRDFAVKKPVAEDYPQAESSFYNRPSQSNVSSIGPAPSGFRAGADSPLLGGSFGEDNRGHSGSRYRRSADPGMSRGPNAWKGVPNWASPLPNGFMPFPPGPHHHGGFPPMLSQYPPLFGVRPSLEMNHPMPYHMADADRFPGHVRPMVWPNMVDGSVPPHFQGWDPNNGVLRDESLMYGPGHLSNSRGRDMNADLWKPNVDGNLDGTSGSQKDTTVVKASTDEASSAQGAPRPNNDSTCLDDQGTSLKMNTSSGPASTKDIPMTPAKMTAEKTPESFTVDDTANYLSTYLAELDISMDLADPDVYNECITLAVKGESEFVEDLELGYMEERALCKVEITNLTTDLTVLPAVKDSIFQRAMDLYKTQSNGRTTNAKSNEQKLHSPPASQLEANPVFIPNEPVDCSLVDNSVEDKDTTLVVAEEMAQTIGEKDEDPMPITAQEALVSAVPSESPELPVDVGAEGETPLLSAEKVEEKVSEERSPENVAVNNSTPDIDIVGSDGKAGGVESASEEQSGVGVSCPLILSCDDSVKVCEAVMPVSNESESVILSRIHHAPESTH